jgi:hypothetical protein
MRRSHEKKIFLYTYLMKKKFIQFPRMKMHGGEENERG